MNLNNTLLTIYDYLYHNENDKGIIDIINTKIIKQNIYIIRASKYEYQRMTIRGGGRIKIETSAFSSITIYANGSYINSTHMNSVDVIDIFKDMLAYIKYKNRKNIIENI